LLFAHAALLVLRELPAGVGLLCGLLSLRRFPEVEINGGIIAASGLDAFDTIGYLAVYLASDIKRPVEGQTGIKPMTLLVSFDLIVTLNISTGQDIFAPFNGCPFWSFTLPSRVLVCAQTVQAARRAKPPERSECRNRANIGFIISFF
jgi:hypothetical protein